MAIPSSRLNPKYLHSNSTSHVWVFSALAELIDNAYDPDVNAKILIIDKEEIGGKTCLVFQDNGAGMDNDHLHKMLSFGYCEKDELKKKSHLPIGHYGNGFKSGSMRLGKDALSRSSLKAILNHSLFTEEKDLIGQFENIKDKTGTRIIIYNLCELSGGELELDFDSNPKDILCREIHIDGEVFTEVVHAKKKLKYRQSFREYCRILYYWPRMKIILRRSTVRTKMIAKSLSQTEVDVYRPKWLKKAIHITIGFRCEDHDSEDYGMMLYHNNRLIKAYEKVGYQKQATDKGFGVIGVAQVDFLQPIHNKQDFIADDKYYAVMKAFGEKLNDYWNEKDLIQENFNKVQPDSLWANCDLCGKWRRLPKGTDKDSLPDEWFCCMNKDKKHCYCDDPEEKEKDDEYAKPSYQKKIKRKLKEQKSLEKQSRQNAQRKVSQEQEEGSQPHPTEKSLTHPPSTSFSDSPSKNSVSRKRLADTSDHEASGSPIKPSPLKRKRGLPQPLDKGMKSMEYFFKKKIMPADSTLDCNEADTAKNQMLEASASPNSSDSMLHVTNQGNIDSSRPAIKANHLEIRKTHRSLSLSILKPGPAESLSPKAHEKMATLKNQTFSTSPESPISPVCDSDPSQKEKDNSPVIDVDTLPRCSFAQIKNTDKTEDQIKLLKEHQQKLRNLENRITPPLAVVGNRQEKETKFQRNVHYLLKLLVPKLVIADVSSTEQLVEDLIGLIETTDLDF
ncbi:MORC CW-type zinc finger protein 3 [Bulinus truncatus]|nr:MORC CW-type zinc finger protein 3 [Bulinus truncatus]